MPSTPQPVLDQDAQQSLSELRHSEQKLADQLIPLIGCRSLKDSVFKDDSALQVNTIDDEPNVVIASYAGTTVRFKLLLGIAANGKAVGRVVCSLQYDLHNKVRYKYLGDFIVGTDGMTDFAPDGNGKYHYMQHDADYIVAHFLKKAHEQNLLITE
jgi:hypothetical protein